MALFRIFEQNGKLKVVIMGIKLSFRNKDIIRAYFSKKHNNKIILIKNGKEHPVKKISGIKIKFEGDNNTIKVAMPHELNGSRFYLSGSNNEVSFDKNCKGNWVIYCQGDNNKATVRENTGCCDVTISLINSEIKIGKNCMMSNSIRIWTDGHAVIDNETKKCINLPTQPILIGDHVWIGERVTLTKNARIPSNSIVGIASVVTKVFTEEHTLIAGNPAQIRKKGISWDERSPIDYINNEAQ